MRGLVLILAVAACTRPPATAGSPAKVLDPVTCGAGYELTPEGCSDVDECARGLADCGLHAHCTNTAGSYACSCPQDATGDGFTCTCPDGYELHDDGCDDVNECSRGTATCAPHAMCRNWPGSYACNCPRGSTGDGFTCTCPDGFELNDDGCDDVNECRFGLDTCDSNAVCTNTIGSYTCACGPDYTGDGKSCVRARVTSLAAGPLHACALRDNGSVLCWGAPDGGALGTGGDGRTPARTSASGESVQAIGAGGVEDSLNGPVRTVTCAIDVGSNENCWGLGYLSHVLAVRSWRSVGATLDFTWEIDADGDLSGDPSVPVLSADVGVYSDDGQEFCLVHEDGTMSCALAYGEASLVAGSWKAVAVGWFRTCGIGSDGTLSCWAGHATPVRIGDGSDWERIVIGKADRSYYTPPDLACGLRAGGHLWCWGQNEMGGAGNGTAEVRPEPVEVQPYGGWVDVALGVSFACGLREDGDVLCWGRNERGQLGRGPDGAPTAEVRLPGRFSSVDQEYWHACALGEDGAGYCWGYGQNGQLGDGALSSRAAPVRVGEGRWKSLTAGGFHSCGVRDDGALFCWGALVDTMQPGYVTETRPARIGDASDWVLVDAGMSHTCGLRANGSAWCWGSNGQGELGTGSSDEDVVGLVQVLPGTSWKSLAVFDGTSCGETTAGDRFCWGAGYVWNLTPLPPTQVESFNPHHEYAQCRLEGATVVCSGTDRYGMLGDGKGFDPDPGPVLLP